MKLGSKEQWNRLFFPCLVIISFLALILTVFLDIPVARQVLGFAFLSLVPGAILSHLLKLKELSRTEIVLIYVGLSIAFMMISSLLLNQFAELIGFQEPFQIVPLMIVLVSFIIVGVAVAYVKSDNLPSFDNIIHRKNLLLMSFFGIVIASAVGAVFVDVYGKNIISMLILLLIPLLFGFLVLLKEPKSSGLYVIVIFTIALSLLFHSSLISRFIVGSDSPLEFMVFRITAISHRWGGAFQGSLGFGRFASMLSITVLPTFYSVVMNLNSTLVFKLIYPLIFALVPVCLYQTWQHYVGKKYALIAAFLLMAQLTFYTEMLGLNRQIIAEFFFSLLLLVLLNKKLKPLAKKILFVVFSIGLVTSHYGLSLVFLFFISAVFILLYIRKRESRILTTFELMSFFVIMFSWYIFTSSSAVFDDILQFGQFVFSQFGGFFNPASRGQAVLVGLGLTSAPTIWSYVSRGFAYATELLILIAFIGLVTKRLNNKFDRDYLFFNLIACSFLGALVIVPGLAQTLNITRFYHILLFFLAPLCVLGADFLATIIYKRRKSLVTLVLLVLVLIPYFLFQTGFVYEVTRSGSYSASISMNRISITDLSINYTIMDAGSVFAAIWLSEHVTLDRAILYSDDAYRNSALMSYGMIYSGISKTLSNVTLLQHNDLVFLGASNTETQGIYTYYGQYNFSQLAFNFSALNKIYDNGFSEIYRTP